MKLLMRGPNLRHRQLARRQRRVLTILPPHLTPIVRGLLLAAADLIHVVIHVLARHEGTNAVTGQDAEARRRDDDEHDLVVGECHFVLVGERDTMVEEKRIWKNWNRVGVRSSWGLE